MGAPLIRRDDTTRQVSEDKAREMMEIFSRHTKLAQKTFSMHDFVSSDRTVCVMDASKDAYYTVMTTVVSSN